MMLAALALMPALSCGDDPVEPKNDGGIDWPDMTARDDVVEALLLTYANPENAETASRFEALLHSKYFFALDAADVGPGDPQKLTRAEDIAATEWIFENHTMLELDLEESGPWQELLELEGQTCGDCWESTRMYFIMVQFHEEETIHLSPAERVAVSIIVAPDERDPARWVIRAMYDMRMMMREERSCEGPGYSY
jgi:hypothetical protein